MIRDDMNQVTNEEFDKLVETFDKAFTKHFKDNNILEEYVSYYIAERIKHNFLFREQMDDVVFSALNDLSQFYVADCDYDKIKQLLETKYKLKITNENPLEIISI